MADEIQSNPYFKEALSYVDDELLKYQGDEQLTWWAQAIVGLFGDFVDVEAISQIDSNVNYFTEMLEGFSSSTSPFSLAYWKCGDSEAMAKIWLGVFLIVSSNQECNLMEAPISQAKIMFSYFHCKFSVCKDSLNPDLCLSTCVPYDGGGEYAMWDCTQTCTSQVDNCADCKACCNACHPVGGDDFHACVTLCIGDWPGCTIPCYYCDLPGPPLPQPNP